MSALDKPSLCLVVIPIEVYLESMPHVSMVEAFSQHLPPFVVCSYMIYNSLEDQMVLLSNQIGRLVRLQHVSSENVDQLQRVVSSPSLRVL